MPVSVIVGGQYGSEGKGKVAYFLARAMKASVAIRVGGPNSGHTVVDPDGVTRVLRQLPTAALISGVVCVLPPGSYVRQEVLESELAMTAIPPDNVALDPRAVVITDEDVRDEIAAGIRQAIGSTATGTGAALGRRIGRVRQPLFAADVPELSHLLMDTGTLLRQCLKAGQRVILEGTQGFGLSVLHSPFYPHVTARDTTASGFLSEAGLSPLDVDDVVLVLRSFPIRVPGSSGPLSHEIDWETVAMESGSPRSLVEYTSVTKGVRRVARFDAAIPKGAIDANTPTRLVMNHVDYVDWACRDSDSLSDKARQFLATVSQSIGRRIDYAGVGPNALIPSPG